MHNALLNNIATEIVANKVMDDKMKDYDEAQQRQIQEEEDLLKPKEDKEEAVLDNIDCGDLDHYCSI